MDILLMSPYTIRSYTELPMSLLFLKYYVQDHGYQADILDCSAYPEDLDEVIEIIKSKPLPRYFGVTSYTRERFYAYALIKRLKFEFPDVPIIVGGRHFSALPEETLESLPVDIVVIGEGEVTLKYILDGNPAWKIPGIAFRDEGIYENPPGPPHKNIDDFRCFDINDTVEAAKYRSTLSIKGIRKRWIRVTPSRGCPFNCTFCSIIQQTVRYRSITNVAEEIKQKRELTGINDVVFGSESLTLKRSYTEAICDEMIRLGVDSWKCDSRVDIDLDLLTRMREAGCVQVEVGLESGSPKVLKRIKKNINTDQFRKFIIHCKMLGIKAHVFMMTGLPGEAAGDADMSIKLLNEMFDCISSMSIQVCRVLPDAPLYQEAKDLGIIDPNFNWFQPYEIPKHHQALCLDEMYHTVPLWIGDMTIEEIREKQVEFQRVMRQRSTVHTLRQAVAYNLSKEGRKHLVSWAVWKDKINKLTETIYYSIRNMK